MERRIHRRRDVTEPCNLILDNKAHSVRLINISEGGLRLKSSGRIAHETRGELDAPGLGLRVRCRVVAADAEEISVAFDRLVTLPASLDGAGMLAA